MLLVLLAAMAIEETAADRVSQAIARGIAAEEAGDGPGMAAAARGLAALNARPRRGEPDLVRHWQRRSLQRGHRDRTPPMRGRALGPAYSRGVLAPGATLSTEQVFLAGQEAEVLLVPQPGRALTIRILAKGAPLCEQASRGTRVKCGWIPTFTQRVSIRIANAGPDSARYYLVSN